MNAKQDSRHRISRGKKLLMRLWGALPILLLLAVIIILGQMINTKKDRLEAVKKGLSALESMQLAADKIDTVASILKTSADQKIAAERLQAELGLSADQVKTILHMPLSELVKDQQEKLDRQVADIKQQMAENKLDIRMDRPDVNVVALTLAPETIRDRINLPGVVEPWIKFDVIAEVRGEVIEKRMEKGTPVKEDDIIAVLDKSDYEIALQAAKAAYDTALASKNRVEKLYAQQLAPRAQLDDITAQVERFKAEMDTARLNLDRCTIKSPITGTLNQLYIDKGQYINVADPIAEVIQMDRVKVNVGIPESDVSAIRTVDDYMVRFDALSDKAFPAKKYFLSIASGPQARLYKLELEIDNPAHDILPDMFARVDIVKREVPNALSIPLYSIISLNDRQTVYVINDDTAHARNIQTGIQEGWQIQVTDGLKPGDRVIVTGHRRVSDGQAVNLVRTVSDMKEIRN